MSSIPFDRIAHRYEETRGGLERGRQIAKALGMFLDPGSRVLEICVGTGAVAKPLSDDGHTVTGIDLSRPMLNLADNRLPGVLVEGDASKLPVAADSHDAVLAVWAVHVVGDQQALYDEVVRVLKPGGLFFVVASTPRVDSNDVADIAFRMGPALGRGWDRSNILAGRIAGHGLVFLTEVEASKHLFSETPSDRAAAIERRDWSSLWELDDAEWADKIQPIVDDLRALPNQNRKRKQVHRHDVSVYRNSR